jgi:hypothetical protein
MLNKLIQLLKSTAASGPCPSGVCLWHDIEDLTALAQELAEETLAEELE